MRLSFIAVLETTNKVTFIGRQDDRRDSVMIFIVVTVRHLVLPAGINLFRLSKNERILNFVQLIYLNTCIPFTFACLRSASILSSLPFCGMINDTEPVGSAR